MKWVEVFFTYDEIEAEIIKDILKAEDIEVAVKSQRVSPFPANVCRMGEIKLMVKDEDLDRAREVIKIMSDNK